MTVKRRTQLMLEPEQYQQLQVLAESEDTSVSNLVREAIDLLLHQRTPPPITEDPMWEIVGIGEGGDLIDGIPVSEDPGLYYVADLMARKGVGSQACREGPLHAWEIAPQRYTRGPDGRAVRIDGSEQ